jgi:nucleoside-diphosphate-sugar epimerase
MAVMVTGGAGFIGGAWARRARDRGERVVSLDREPSDAGVESERVDLRDASLVARVVARHAPSLIVHAAARLPVRGDAREVYATNVDGTRAVLDAARRAGVPRVVVLSSSSLYALEGGAWRTEDAQLAPVSDYGRSKAMAEALCARAVAEGMSVAWLRLVPVVGPGRRGLFHHLCAWAREGRRVPMLGDGRNRVQLAHVDDVCDAVDALWRDGATGAFNCGAEAVATVREELDALCAAAGAGASVVSIPAAPTEAALLALHRLGLSPAHPWMVRAASREMTFDVARLRRVGWRARHRSDEALVATLRDAESPEGPAGTHRAPWRSALLEVLRRFA